MMFHNTTINSAYLGLHSSSQVLPLSPPDDGVRATIQTVCARCQDPPGWVSEGQGENYLSHSQAHLSGRHCAQRGWYEMKETACIPLDRLFSAAGSKHIWCAYMHRIYGRNAIYFSY